MAEWSIPIDKYAEARKKDIQEVRRVLVFMLWTGIVKLTPVDTGRARCNWLVTTGKPSDVSSLMKDRNFLPKGNDMPVAEGDESYFITNNLPYINKLEYGYSKQAAHGMVGVTVSGVQKRFEKAVAAVKDKKGDGE